jgi:hypothetical protein
VAVNHKALPELASFIFCDEPLQNHFGTIAFSQQVQASRSVKPVCVSSLRCQCASPGFHVWDKRTHGGKTCRRCNASRSGFHVE